MTAFIRFAAIGLILFLHAGVSLAQTKATIALNWVPEPEFGGIYQAKIDGTFAANGLDVEIKPGGAGAPTWQRVAQGQVEFAVASADEVVIARSNGADVVAIFTIYQTCPQGIMTHAERGFRSLEDVFKAPGTMAIEIGLPYGKFLEKKYGFANIQRVPYTGGVTNFLADKNFSQQCFVFSEPIVAKRQGADPKTFLIAESGYNPYTGVIITRGRMIRDNPQAVLAMVESLERGWTQYLLDPRAANAEMQPMNPAMDPETFALGAEAQAPLVQMEFDQERPLGQMRVERWEELIAQLKDLRIIDSPPNARDCFIPRDALAEAARRE
jgi:NitT/TauT family transport system substrate-binding protein